jgi:lactate permease
MIWTQNYAPIPPNALDPHGVWMNPLVAALPVVVLLGLLASGRVPAVVAALAGLACAIAAAIFVFTPPEASGTAGTAEWAKTVFAAAGDGAAFGLFPIGWIVLAAIFLYSLTVEAGQFEIVKYSVLSLSGDRRLQALLIAFCFGAFVEGAAGFGTPVAISSALLVGAGFRPLHAAGLALIANTAPVAFGALGTPLITLARITLPPGTELAEWELRLSAMAGRQLPFFSFIVPIWLVWVMAGWRGVRGVWPALLVCGGSFAIVQFLVSNFHGPALVDVIGGVVSLVATALFLRVWKPKEEWHFAGEPPPAVAPTTHTRRQIISAWVPWALLTAFVFVWGLPAAKKELGAASVQVNVPWLHERVTRTQPVVERSEPEKAVFDFNWLSATGTGIFLAAVASALWMRIAPVRFVLVFANSIWRLRWPLVTIACMLAIAFTTRYSGIDATLGLAFTRTGVLYPLFAAMLGWLGVALTGSDTSSNALFGSLQTITARRLVAAGVLPLSADQAMVLLASANSTGGVMGKMIDAQSIVVAAAATQQHGQEGAILRFVFWHSVALALMMGGLVMIQAYLWQASIP